MTENELHGDSVDTVDATPPAQPTPDVFPSGRACGHCAKRTAKRRKKAGQSEAYREHLAEVALENADFLTALANYAAEKVPSATQPLNDIVTVYSQSTSARIARL
ncbi:hypothetical protein FACS1894132_02300 [Clostridia bacterium]|nr:hypothetical protein FACS1894132_02300 [Clostridia bacterium]